MIFTSDNGADLNARERAGEAFQVPHLALVSEWVGVDPVHVAHAQGQVAQCSCCKCTGSSYDVVSDSVHKAGPLC